jgi:hypothetical protein
VRCEVPMTEKDNRLIKAIGRKAEEQATKLVEAGVSDFCEIHIKHINGELVSRVEYSNKDKV